MSLDGITNSMDMTLSGLRDVVLIERKPERASVHGVSKS